MRWLLLAGLAACSNSRPAAVPPGDGAPHLDAGERAPDGGITPSSRAPGGVAGLVTLAAPRPRAETIPGPALEPCKQPAPPAVRMSPYAGVVGALVWLEGEGLPPASGEPGELVLHDCGFTRRVVLVPHGQKLVVRNDDPLRHTLTLAPDSGGAPLFQIVLPLEGSRYELELPPGSRLLATSDGGAHAVVAQTEQGGAGVTDSDGKFSLGTVPPGRYHLKAWHPGRLAADQEVTVKPGEMTEQNLILAGP